MKKASEISSNLLKELTGIELQEVRSEIKRLRSQMLIHSFLYYELEMPIWTDHFWQEQANKLRDLQDVHPDFKNIGWYDDYFQNWTGDSGFHLPKDEWVRDRAVKTWSSYVKFYHLAKNDPRLEKYGENNVFSSFLEVCNKIGVSLKIR